jgi:hypothetical protein
MHGAGGRDADSPGTRHQAGASIALVRIRGRRYASARMPITPRSCSLVLAVVGAACTVPPSPSSQLLPSEPQNTAPRGGRNEFGNRVLIEGMAIPGVWLTRDGDGGFGSNEHVDGAGYGVRAAAGNHERSVGLLFQQLFTSGDELDAQILSIDVDARTPMEARHRWFWLRAGGSVGCAWMDAAGDEELDRDATFQLRIGVDFQPSDRFLINASFGGIVIGHPGETEAYGSLVTIGAALIF